MQWLSTGSIIRLTGEAGRGTKTKMSGFGRFHSLLTGLSTAVWPFRRRKEPNLDELLVALQQVLGRIERLEGQHISLRGYVYAKKGLVGSGEAPPAAEQGALPFSAPLSRDELRRQLVTSGRFVPGHAPRHQEKT